MERRTLDDTGYTPLPPIRKNTYNTPPTYDQKHDDKKRNLKKANTLDAINATEKRRGILPPITPGFQTMNEPSSISNADLELGCENRKSKPDDGRLQNCESNVREVPLNQPTPREEKQEIYDDKGCTERGRTRTPRPPSAPYRKQRQGSGPSFNQCIPRRPFPGAIDVNKRRMEAINPKIVVDKAAVNVECNEKSVSASATDSSSLERTSAVNSESKTEPSFSVFQGELQEQITDLMEIFDSYDPSCDDKFQAKDSHTDDLTPDLPMSYDSLCSTVIGNIGDSKASNSSMGLSPGYFMRDAAVDCNLISPYGNICSPMEAKKTSNIAVECKLDDPSKYMQWARDEVFEFLLETADERYKDLLEELKEKLMRPNLNKVNLFTPTSLTTTKDEDSDRIHTDRSNESKDKSLSDHWSDFTFDLDIVPMSPDTIGSRSDVVIGVVKKAPLGLKPLPRYRYMAFHKNDLIGCEEEHFKVPDITEETQNEGIENETKPPIEDSAVNSGRETVTLDKHDGENCTVITSSSAHDCGDSENKQGDLSDDDNKSNGTFVVKSRRNNDVKYIHQQRIRKSTLPWHLRVSKVKRKEGVGCKNFRKCSECKCKKGYKIKGILTSERVKNAKFWFHKRKRTFLCLCRDCMKRHDDLHFAIRKINREDDERPWLIPNQLNNHELYVNEQGLLRGKDFGVPRVPKRPKIELNPKIPKIPEFGVNDMESLVKNDLIAQQRDAVKVILQGSTSSPVESEMVDKEMSCCTSLRNQNIFDDQSYIQCRIGGDCKHQNPHIVDFVRNRRNSETATVCARPLEEVAPQRHVELIKKKIKEKENENAQKEYIGLLDEEIDSRTDEWVADTLKEKVRQSRMENKELLEGKLRYNSFDGYNLDGKKILSEKGYLSYGSVFEEKRTHPEVSRICLDINVKKKAPLLRRRDLVKEESDIALEEIHEDSNTLHKLPILMSSSEKKSSKTPSSVSPRSLAALKKTRNVLPSIPKVVTTRQDRPVYYKKVTADQKKRALNTMSKIKEEIRSLPAPVNHVDLTYSRSVNGQLRYQYLLNEQAKTEKKIQELLKQLEEVDEQDDGSGSAVSR